MRILFAGLAALLLAPGLQAQQVGEWVRFQRPGGIGMVEARLVGMEGPRIRVASGLETAEYRAPDLARLSYWQPKNRNLTFLGSVAGGALGFWLSGKIDDEHYWITGSEKGAVITGAAIGALVDILFWAFDPNGYTGNWEPWP